MSVVDFRDADGLGFDAGLLTRRLFETIWEEALGMHSGGRCLWLHSGNVVIGDEESWER